MDLIKIINFNEIPSCGEHQRKKGRTRCSFLPFFFFTYFYHEKEHQFHQVRLIKIWNFFDKNNRNKVFFLNYYQWFLGQLVLGLESYVYARRGHVGRH